jgi:hypothetical protein
VSISISGQNERWAQLNAYQPPSSRSGQNSASYPAIGTAPPPAPGTATPGGGSAGALSDGTSLALIAFGSLGNAQTTAQSSGTLSTGTPATGTPATGTPAVSPASPGSTTGTQDETSLEAQILGDVQSLISDLTGSTSTPATSGTGSTSQNPLTTASLSQPAPPSGPPPGGNTISDEDTNATTTGTGNAGGAAPGYSDAIQQQFALSAYSANNAGLDSSATASLTNISV